MACELFEEAQYFGLRCQCKATSAVSSRPQVNRKLLELAPRHPLEKEAHRTREAYCLQIMGTLQGMTMNALRLDGRWMIGGGGGGGGG